jgi:hypothetical protein
VLSNYKFISAKQPTILTKQTTIYLW